MENLDRKIVGNATISYFLIIICIFFLFSKKPELSHNFVKSHAKSAIVLHVLLILMLYIMSFDFLGQSLFLSYSLNDIITMILSLSIFGAMLYSMRMAQKGKTITLGEIFSKATGKNIQFSETKGETLTEEQQLTLILGHIPIFGYMSAAKNMNIPHYRDILIINSSLTFLCIVLLNTGYTSLASFLFLLYTIYAVFQSIRIVISHEIVTPNMEKIPTFYELYLYGLSLNKYLKKYLGRSKFMKFSDIYIQVKTQKFEEEKKLLDQLMKLPESKFHKSIWYLPIVNLLGIFFLRTQEKIHIQTGIMLTIFIVITALILSVDSPVLLFFVFPLSYGIGYLPRKAYKIPFVYDIFASIRSVFLIIGRIFRIGRKLQKTDKNISVKMNQNTPTPVEPDKIIRKEQPSQDA